MTSEELDLWLLSTPFELLVDQLIEAPELRAFACVAAHNSVRANTVRTWLPTVCAAVASKDMFVVRVGIALRASANPRHIALPFAFDTPETWTSRDFAKYCRESAHLALRNYTDDDAYGTQACGEYLLEHCAWSDMFRAAYLAADPSLLPSCFTRGLTVK